ncbi:hypothetical protein LTR16_000836, partial [Cryomyces antarcticus]
GTDELSEISDYDVARKLEIFLVCTPPESEHQESEHIRGLAVQDFEHDHDSLVNMDAAGEVSIVDESTFMAMQRDYGGFTLDIDWMEEMEENNAANVPDHGMMFNAEVV